MRYTYTKEAMTYEYTMTRRRTLSWFTLDKSLLWPLDKPAALQIEDNAEDKHGDEAQDKPGDKAAGKSGAESPDESGAKSPDDSHAESKVCRAPGSSRGLVSDKSTINQVRVLI